jgi:hypothetical protein
MRARACRGMSRVAHFCVQAGCTACSTPIPFRANTRHVAASCGQKCRASGRPVMLRGARRPGCAPSPAAASFPAACHSRLLTAPQRPSTSTARRAQLPHRARAHTHTHARARDRPTRRGNFAIPERHHTVVVGSDPLHLVPILREVRLGLACARGAEAIAHRSLHVMSTHAASGAQSGAWRTTMAIW